MLGAVVGCGFRVLLLEWCVRFGAGMLVPLQDAAGCCQSAVRALELVPLVPLQSAGAVVAARGLRDVYGSVGCGP